MSNNEYSHRPWHLPEHAHVTNWAAREMCRPIKRANHSDRASGISRFATPTRHRSLQLLRPLYGCRYRPTLRRRVVARRSELPFALKQIQGKHAHLRDAEIRRIRRAFYALCTHIDHQLRVVIGTLREEGLLDDTIILFTSDHGDMLGNHGVWAKRLYYERAANVPMILVGGRDGRVPHHVVDERLVGWQDVMPTLLDLADIEVPDSVEGLSMVGDARRSALYGECGEDASASRMIRDEHYKLIYYPVGNRTQLFDLQEDPDEHHPRQKPMQAYAPT